MSFWEQMRQEVRERTTTGDISSELFDTIASTGITGAVVIQPTFYLGRFFILSCDYMDFVEKVLASDSSPKNLLRQILYIRETVNMMGRCIRNSSEPIDAMMNFLDPIYEEACSEEGLDEHLCDDDCCHDDDCCCHDDDCDCEEEDLDDEFKVERQQMIDELRSKFLEAGMSEIVSDELSKRMGQTYSACVTFVRELRTLHNTEPMQDITNIMVSLIDLQYIMNTKLRVLLLEDVFIEERPTFVSGLMPWISHGVEQLARQHFANK